MSDTIESSTADIRMAYRLMLHDRVANARNKGDRVAEKAALDELEKDGAQISNAGRSAQAANVNAPQSNVELNVDIRLADLVQKLHTQQVDPQAGQQLQILDFQQTIETQASLTYYSLEPVEGLVVRNRNLAETDRYRFEFQDGSTLKITDKWSNRSTTIWGDPHVDLSDMEGTTNGDFKDLKASDQFTTFMLLDGTRLTITARDTGIIEAVDIFKGDQHLSGIGSGSKSWDDKTGLFNLSVKMDAFEAISRVSVGDVVYAGGDGNDWYDTARNLVWGKTTGLAVTSRPSSVIEFQYNQTITQSLSVLQVNA